MTDPIKKIKDSIRNPTAKAKSGLFLSSGLTLMNLALTGKLNACWEAGGYYLLVGGSRSGKTFIVLQTLAEAANNPKFDKYELVLFAPERGAKMDIARFFGKKLADRMRWEYPKSLDEFYFVLDNYLAKGPTVAALDSNDALRPLADREKFEERKAAWEKGKDTSGSYGMQKAKDNKAGIREAHNRLSDHGSILLIIAQTIANVGFGAMFNPETRAGGNALTFFADGELWFSVGEPVKRTVRGKPRKIGSVLQVKIKKNRDTGREPSVELLHFPSAGFDDTGSLVRWLCEEGVWSETKGVINAGEWGQMRFEELVRDIEARNREKDLKLIVASEWSEIENGCSVTRKKKYV